MKATLLEMVSDILNDLDSDVVNSIDDTVESQQVAQILKSCYNGMMSNRSWPHMRKAAVLNGLGDTSKPNYLRIPERWHRMETFNYDKQTAGLGHSNYSEVKYKEPDAFLRLVSMRNDSVSSVVTVSDFSGVSLQIINNLPPTYWTSFDDVYIVTDSYDAAVDTTLQSSKTQCIAYVEPTWSMVDDFIPDLPSDAFTALIEEAKSTAFISLKQSNNPKAEQKAARQNRWLARQAWVAQGGVVYSDFGRKSRK